ncbi:hypothetical protein FKW77_009183 [Venturia effusa]|uniref:Uncharacterized protein n=1 Tax=Venturia effusa TaxID=50376 RepID=A0A517L639_9PEZI|nr:hypothetical protein FKW77_009183 [Venturia effusa]
MAGDKPPNDAPPTEQQQLANGTANMLAHAAAATQASEEESRENIESRIARGNHIAHHERPTRLMSADSYYDRSYARSDEKPIPPENEPPIEQVPPPAYSSDVLGHVEEQGLGTNASVANDGRVNITIDQRSQKLSSLLVPALRNQRRIIAKEKPLPSPYIPPSLGGSPGELPPPPLNIVIMVVGSRGDVQPFLALGKVLKETYGHRVRLATHPTFKDFIEGNGLEFFSIGGDPSELMAFMVKNPGLMPGFDTLRNGDVGKRRANIAEMIRGCWRACIEAGDGSGIEASDDAIGDWMTDDPVTGGLASSPDDANPRPFVADAIIANPPSFAHVHCAERLGIPLHMMFTMPWSPTEAFPHPLANITSSNADQTVSNYITYALVDMLTWQGLGDVINRFRVHILGLEPISLVWGPGMLARLKVPYTYCWSPALIPKPNDWGSHISLSGFYFLEQASNFTPAPDLKAFLDAGPPPVYIGFGSIVVDDPNAMTTMIFEAVKKSGQRALVSKGWGGFGADELGIPDGVFMLGNVPHDWLFQHVSCVVHHGGAGTTAAGIAAGKPTFVVPFFGDQPFWGSMVNRAGAGPPPVPHKDLTADSLAAGILECIKPSSQEKAKIMALKISKEKGTDTGAQSFHQMLDVDKLRCSILPEQAAVWRVKRTQIRLSALAAYVLAEKSVISFADLKLYRPREYEVEMGPTDPISGGASAVIETLTSTMMGVADFPVATLKALAIHPDASKGKGKGKATEEAVLSTGTGSSTPLTANTSSTTVNQPRSSISSDVTTSTPVTSPGTLTPVASKESRSGDVLTRESSGTAGGSLSPVTSEERSSRDSVRSPRGGSMAEALRSLPEKSRPRSSSRGGSGSSPHRRSSSMSKKKPSHTSTWTEGAHSPGPDLLDTAYGTGKGISKISGSLLKSPMDVLLGISKGFHNMPKLYGEEVRQTDRVTGIKSGFRVAGKELGLGFFDGITGLVTQPLQGAKKEGAAGFVKGFGKGIAGLVVKPGAGIYGLPGYAMKGIYKEIQRHFGASANNYIIAARTAQGWEAWLQTDKGTQTEIVHRYLQVVELVKKSDKKGGKEDSCEAVQEYIEKRKKKRREAWEKLAKNVQTKKSTIQQSLQTHCPSTKDGKPASHSTSDLLHQDGDASSRQGASRANSTGHLLHAATFPAPSTSYQDDSDDDTMHDHDLNEAIRQSVMDSSTGDQDEDALIHRAIQASMTELQRGQGSVESTTTMSDTAEEEEQLRRAIEESMRSARGADQDASAQYSESSHIVMRDLENDSSSHDYLPPPYESDVPAVPPRSPRRAAVANRNIQGEPPSYGDEESSMLCATGGGMVKESSDDELAADNAEDEANLQRALEESMKQDEKSGRERTEEEIVLEYVKKQSLLEEEHPAQILGTEAFKPEEAVHEASKILQRVSPSSRRTNPRNQSGVSYYAKELFSALFLAGPPNSHSETPSPSQPLIQAVELLEHAADEGSPDALYMLAEMNFHGNFTHPRNYTEAFRRYQQLATLDGNSSAQHMIGFMYATGIGGAVRQDQAKAMLYYTFAAEAGNTRAEMAIAYRHHTGIATPRNCEEAVHYYKKVADKAMRYLRSGPIGGHMVVREAYRLADENGGVYGEGASVVSAGANAKQGGPNSDAHASFEDVIEYLDLMSRKGDLKATFSLGKLYYDGARGMKRDLRMAKQYFLRVAREQWPKKGRPSTEISASTERLAAKAAGFLGRMFLRGEGMRTDFEVARVWFKRGISNGDALSQYSMGLMYLYGHGVEADPVKASEYFAPAADQDLNSAQVRLGALMLDQGDIDTAEKYFRLANRNGHVEAAYYLGELANNNLGREAGCNAAAMYYKIVAEKTEVIVASFKEANEAYESGDVDTALVAYMLAAEQGFENAQSNVAYILDQQRPRLPFPMIGNSFQKKISVIGDAGLALLYWTRSAKQSNTDSLVKMGDYYLEGFGTAPDTTKAAACYQAAAESLVSAQAYWNLGWMHENGIGMDQDFHLAKRFYDHALETNEEAFLPVTLALFKLRARSFWNSITYGKINSIRNEEPVQKKSWSEWLNAFLEADAAGYQNEHFDERDDWEHMDTMPGGDDFYDELDDGIVESLLIVGLAAALALLVMYRRRRADERERRQQRANGQVPVVAADRAPEQEPAAFAQPGDLDFIGWNGPGL